MNRWDILPCDAQNHIFDIVAAQTIQENWREHDRRTTYTINLLKKYTDITPWTNILDTTEFCHRCDCTDPQTVIELEYCVKHCEYDPDLWINLILNMEEGLRENRFVYCYSFIRLYRRIETAISQLRERLDVYALMPRERQTDFLASTSGEIIVGARGQRKARTQYVCWLRLRAHF